MAPKHHGDLIVTTENDELLPNQADLPGPVIKDEKLPPQCHQIVWRNVILFIILHTGALVGIYTATLCSPATWAWTVVYALCSALGVTAGAHRLWAHRTYRAKLPLRIFLAICNTAAFQNHIYEWSRDHRVHHKYSETHADPHNVNRGFFFAHMGWLCVRKHPDVISKGRKLDLSDLVADPVVMIQKRFYLPGVALFCFTLPAVIPHLFWGESLINAYFFSSLLRYAMLLHFTWCVNSVAHLWGSRPYDKTISPVENIFVSMGAAGEGFHNYHHTFPQDYSTSEYGWKFNMSTMFIDVMAAIGQAYNRRKISPEIVLMRKLRTGDGKKTDWEPRDENAGKVDDKKSD